jgi:hypothetical protein
MMPKRIVRTDGLLLTLVTIENRLPPRFGHSERPRSIKHISDAPSWYGLLQLIDIRIARSEIH